LPLPPQIATILKKWRLQCPTNDLDLLLPNDTGGIMHPSTLYDALKRAQTASGVRKLDIKAFRHTFATALIEGGEADTQIARLMGHADTTVTRRVYAHAFERPEGSQVATNFANELGPVIALRATQQANTAKNG
jgi:integrase